MRQLFIGGARSGKSRMAEQAAAELSPAYTLIATGWAGDSEMQARIDRHREDRPSCVSTIEEPIYLADALQAAAMQAPVILIDCLTLWLSNCLHKGVWREERERFLSTLGCMSTPVVIVSNEVGSGIVPLGELTRQFADEAGWLNQAVAVSCEQVTLVVAGLTLPLKNASNQMG